MEFKENDEKTERKVFSFFISTSLFSKFIFHCSLKMQFIRSD